MKDIKQQWSRLNNGIYRQYLDGGITKEQYEARNRRINKAYDRYERKIARQQGKPARRGISNYPGVIDHNVQYSRNTYMGNAKG